MSRAAKTVIWHASFRWKTTTFLAALRYDGLTAPVVAEGATNGEWFSLYVKRILLPTHQKGDIVATDSLSSHKVAGVEEAIHLAGASVLYLPPYSPDLNPIEMVFSKLKTPIRNAKIRKVEDLWRKLGELCDLFSPEEWRGTAFRRSRPRRDTVRWRDDSGCIANVVNTVTDSICPYSSSINPGIE